MMPFLKSTFKNPLFLMKDGKKLFEVLFLQTYFTHTNKNPNLTLGED